MKLVEVQNAIDNQTPVRVDRGDYGMDPRYRKITHGRVPLTVSRIAKSGKAVIVYDGEEFQVSCRDLSFA